MIRKIITVFYALLLNCILYLPASIASSVGAEISDESCIWVPSLNYVYFEQTASDVDNELNSDQNESWHTNRVTLLKNASRIVEGPNVAVARLSLIYKRFPVDEDYLVKHYDIPYFFISGWSDTRLGVIEQIKLKKLRALTVLGKNCSKDLAVNYSSAIFIKDAYPEKVNDRVQYAHHLLTIFDTKAQNSKLNRIIGKSEEISAYIPDLEEPDRLVNEFFYRFYDSEQALFLQLQSAFNTGKVSFAELVKNIPERSTVYQAVLNISSYYDMCFDCGDTGFRQIEAIRGFANTLYNALFECSANFKLDSYSSPLILISSQIPSSWPDTNWKSRQDDITSVNYIQRFNRHFQKLKQNSIITADNLLRTEKLPPYIAQKLFN